MKTIKPAESLSDYWHHHIQSWQQADTNQSSYCRTHDLNYHRFTYWCRKLTAPSSDPRQAVLRSGFVPVKTVSQVSTGLTATLPNGVVLQGIETENLSVVKELLGLQS
ncbi:MAG: hypothetical protein KAU21_13370 [Gammaproteobacteria bacterium]|nr:hypothetical protein [Gammaproteobacteria bacterium]